MNSNKARTDISGKTRGLITNVMRSDITDRFLPEMIRVYAVSPIYYTFGLLKWKKDEFRKLNDHMIRCMRKIRKSYPWRGFSSRFFLDREKGGMGFPSFVHEEIMAAGSLFLYAREQARSGSESAELLKKHWYYNKV